MSKESDRNELGDRAARHLQTQNSKQGPEFLRNMVRGARNQTGGGKPRGHLKSDIRRDGGTHRK